MEIIIGGPPAINKTQNRVNTGSGQLVEAKIVALREGRKKRDNPDNPNARVMTVIVPEGFKIPKDADSGKYRLFLRFSQQQG